mgnify:CR=1 FL=1
MICEKIGCRPEEIDDLIMALQPPVSYEEYLEEVLRDDPAGEFFCDNYPWAEYVPELDMFDSVEAGENKYIMPYKHRAEFSVDTFHAYEPALYKNYLLDTLRRLSLIHI